MRPYELLIRWDTTGRIAGAHVIEFNENYNGIGDVHPFTPDTFKELDILEISWVKSSQEISTMIANLTADNERYLNYLKELEDVRTKQDILIESMSNKNSEYQDRITELESLLLDYTSDNKQRSVIE